MVRSMMMAFASAWVLTTGVASAAEWYRYTDPDFGFSIALPATGYAVDDQGDRLTLRSIDADVQIDVFSVAYQPDMTFADFAEMVATADPRRVVTYRTGGNSWFVVSGYLDADGAESETIFYAKFMAARDGRSLSAFEISYPRSSRQAMDGFVTRMEKSLTSPQG